MSVGQDNRWQKDAADQNFDYMFKLLIIGNSSVGKTSFLFRYADDSFTSAFVSTVGIDFKVKTVFRQDKRVKLQIWVRAVDLCWIFSFAVTTFNIWVCFYFSSEKDTAGQERYRTITTAYYRGAMGFLLMYDITNEESFNSVQDWWVVFSFLILLARLDNTLLLCRCTQIKTYSWDNAQVILVGNKCDMEDERVISYERGKQLADQLGLEFFETSAKENINVKVSCQMDAETSKFVDWPDWPSSRPSLNVWWTSSATKCPRAWIAIPTWSTRPKGRGWRTKRPLPTPAPANAEHHQVIHYKISTFSPDAPSKENRIKKTPTAAAEKQNTIL